MDSYKESNITRTNLCLWNFIKSINIFLCSQLPCFVQNRTTLVEIGVLNRKHKCKFRYYSTVLNHITGIHQKKKSYHWNKQISLLIIKRLEIYINDNIKHVFREIYIYYKILLYRVHVNSYKKLPIWQNSNILVTMSTKFLKQQVIDTSFIKTEIKCGTKMDKDKRIKNQNGGH